MLQIPIASTKGKRILDAYLTSLRELAKSCEFADLEEEMIRDHIVKYSSHTLTQMLLQQEDLDLVKNVKIACKDPKRIQSPLTTCIPLVDRNASTVADVVARMDTAKANMIYAHIPRFLQKKKLRVS